MCTHADHAREPGALGPFPKRQIGGIGRRSWHGVEHHTVADEAHLPGPPGAASQPDLGKCQISKSHKPCTKWQELQPAGEPQRHADLDQARNLLPIRADDPMVMLLVCV